MDTKEVSTEMSEPHRVFGTRENPIQEITPTTLALIDKLGPSIAERHGCTILRAGDPPDFIGSGVLVSISDRVLVLTARHILRKFDYDDSMWVSWNGEAGFRQSFRQNAIESADFDIGAIPLDDAPVALRNCAFRGSFSSLIESSSDVTFITGVTGCLIEEDHGAQKITMPALVRGVARLPIESWPIADNGNRAYFYYSKHDAMNCKGEKMEVANPKGWSGGGVWSVPQDVDLTLDIEGQLRRVRLHSIVFGVDEDDWTYIGATRIESVLEMLRGKL